MRTVKDSYESVDETMRSAYPNLFEFFRGKERPAGFGTQGAVLFYEKNRNVVMKIGLDSEKAKKLRAEYEKHRAFYDKFSELKKEGRIWSKLKMPKPLNYSEMEGTEPIIFMQAVHGQSLKTKEILARHFKDRKWIERLRMNNLTDAEVERKAIDELGLEQSELDLLATEALSSVAKFYPEFMVRELERSLAVMESEGLLHADFHSGNLMVDYDLDFHMVDFGSVLIKRSEGLRENVKASVGGIMA